MRSDPISDVVLRAWDAAETAMSRHWRERTTPVDPVVVAERMGLQVVRSFAVSVPFPVVLTGTLADPYSGTQITFQRGQDTSTAVQIDHVVALSDAWQKGAQQWDTPTRETFANDPLNLLAADGPLNAQKGDGDTATWLPPNKAFRCQYVARQVAVKHTYELWVTRAEKDAILRVLSACPDEPLPEGGAPNVTVTTPPAPTPEPEPQEGEPFKNCDAARAAGAAPVRVGDPCYGKHLDRDGDGIACE